MEPFVAGIAIKPEPHGPMQVIHSIDVSLESGFDRDCRGLGGPRRNRQITVLSFEQWWEACRGLNAGLPWFKRRANLCVKGMTFGPRSHGKELYIGNVILKITGETAPCERMESVCAGLKKALSIEGEWRGGVTCTVIRPGRIFQGNPVVIL